MTNEEVRDKFLDSIKGWSMPLKCPHCKQMQIDLRNTYFDQDYKRR